MLQVEIKMPDQNELIAQANSILIAPQTIRDGNDYQGAADKLKIVKGFAKQWEEMRTKLKAPILEAGRNIDALFKEPQARLEAAEKTIKRAMNAYDTEQERVQKAEEARLAEIARKEREAIEAKAAEARRVAAEKAEAIRKEAEAAIAAGRAAEAAKLSVKADAVESKGESKAELLAMQAATVVAPIVAPTTENISGVSRAVVWKHRVVDASLIPREYMVPNDTMLAGVAKSTKGAIAIPGVEIYSERVIRSGTTR